jgi:hypothetical protein
VENFPRIAYIPWKNFHVWPYYRAKHGKIELKFPMFARRYSISMEIQIKSPFKLGLKDREQANRP